MAENPFDKFKNNRLIEDEEEDINTFEFASKRSDVESEIIDNPFDQFKNNQTVSSIQKTPEQEREEFKKRTGQEPNIEAFGGDPSEQALTKDPLIDPVSSFFTGGFLSSKAALKLGSSFLKSVGLGVAGGAADVVTDVAAGVVTEKVLPEQESSSLLRLPFNIALNVLTSVGFNKLVSKITSKTPNEVAEALTTGKGIDDDIQKVADEINSNPDIEKKITDLGAEAVRKESKPFKEPSLTELGRKATLPGKSGFEKTAEDILEEKNFITVPKEPQTFVGEPTIIAQKKAADDLAFSSQSGDQSKAFPNIESDTPGQPLKKNIEPVTNLARDVKEDTLNFAARFDNSQKTIGSLGKYIDSINIDRIDSDDSLKLLLEQVSQDIQPLVKKQTRGVLKFDEIEERALLSGISEDKIVKLKPGNVFNAEDALKARMIQAASLKRLEDIKLSFQKTGSQEDLAKFAIARKRHELIQASVNGISSEAGRLLSSFRIPVSPQDIKLQNFEKIVTAFGGRELNQSILERMARLKLDDFTQINKFLNEVGESTTDDKIFEAYASSLLSNPLSWVRNFISNVGTTVFKFTEKPFIVGSDIALSSFTGKPRTRFAGEIAADAYGITAGLKMGIENFKFSFAKELPVDSSIKIDVKFRKAIKGKKGELIRLPFRFLTATDEFFKGLNYGMEVQVQAFRQATKEGLTGDAKVNRIADIILNPSEEIEEKIRKEVLDRVFQSDLGTLAGGANRLITGAEGFGRIIKYIIPFRKTPLNIVKFGLERTPLAFIDIAVRQMQKNPELRLKQGELSDKIGKGLMGTVLGAYVYQLTNEGIITGGGPKDRQKKNALKQKGWQPYSIKVKDRFYSFSRLEPLGSIMGQAADLAEGFNVMEEDEKDDLAVSILASFAKNFSNKTFLLNLTNFIDAMSQPDRKAARFIENTAGSLVPGIVSVTNDYLNDTLVEVKGPLEKIKSRIPILSESLKPRRDIFGDPITKDTPLSPIRISKESKDPLLNEIARLGVGFGKPRSFISHRGKRFELNKGEFDDLLKLTGEEFKVRFKKLFKTKSYDRLSDENKIKQVKRLHERIAKRNRNKILRDIIGRKE